jgi:hypothetical protein
MAQSVGRDVRKSICCSIEIEVGLVEYCTARDRGRETTKGWPLLTVETREYTLHRVAMATFWRTFHHDGKIWPG